MASGTGNLPNQSMSFSPFAILTAEEMNDLVENIESLADGTGIGDGSVTTNTLAQSAVTGEKIANYKVTRQDNTANSSETTARILTGWGVVAYNTGANNVNENVTFDTPFTSRPIVVITSGGDSVSGISYGDGGNSVEGRINIKAASITTSGFNVRIHTGGGTNFGSGNGFYQWIAIGV